MNKIILKDILYNEENKINTFVSPFLYKAILKAMKNACDQTVILCAENVRASVGYDGEDDTYNAEINKESILKTKDQII